MRSVWSFARSVNVIAFIAVLAIGAIGCGGEKNGTGDAGGKAGSSGNAGTGDAGGTVGSGVKGDTGGSGGIGGIGGSGDAGGVGGTGGKGGTGGAGGSGESDAAVDAGASKSDSGGIPSNTYAINGDGTVTDGSTGLMWMRCSAGRSGSDCSQVSVYTYTWQEAINYCDSLNFAGHDDWRLPDIHELISIVDYTKYDPPTNFGPAINEAAFPEAVSPATPNQGYWSSSSCAYDSSNAWVVDFAYGLVSTGIKNTGFYARCVRGGPLAIGPFAPSIISGDRVIENKATGLIWQGCAAGQSGDACQQGSVATYEWQAALSYCEGLTWAGYTDWQLPEIYELISIVDYTKYDPAIDEAAFPTTPTPAFWSSLSPAPSYAFAVYFYSGIVNFNDKRFTYSARCVRGGP